MRIMQWVSRFAAIAPSRGAGNDHSQAVTKYPIRAGSSGDRLRRSTTQHLVSQIAARTRWWRSPLPTKAVYDDPFRRPCQPDEARGLGRRTSGFVGLRAQPRYLGAISPTSDCPDSAITGLWILPSIIGGLSRRLFRPLPPENASSFVISPPCKPWLALRGAAGCGRFRKSVLSTGADQRESARTPWLEGRPSVSRRRMTEAFPMSSRFNSNSSDASRTSPTVLSPAAVNTLRIRAGNSTSLIGVLSGSSGIGSSITNPLVA